jgi:hypothetical protein
MSSDIETINFNVFVNPQANLVDVKTKYYFDGVINGIALDVVGDGKSNESFFNTIYSVFDRSKVIIRLYDKAINDTQTNEDIHAMMMDIEPLKSLVTDPESMPTLFEIARKTDYAYIRLFIGA